MNNLHEILNGGRRPGDETEAVLWDAFKDVILFTCLKLSLNKNLAIDKETVKAEMIDSWVEQTRLDFSRTLEETRGSLTDPDVILEFAFSGLPKPDLVKVEAEFDIKLQKVKGMAIRALDLL